MRNPPSPALIASAPVTYHPLSRLMQRLQARLAPALNRSFWLRAEIGSCNERGGSFYCELVETDNRGVAIAKDTVHHLGCGLAAHPSPLGRRRHGARAAPRDRGGPAVRQGTVVGLQCNVQFHPTHGLSVRALDMDSSFAVGELELRRRRILESLSAEGLLGKNAEVPMPLLPNRILLITSGAGAAFHDFTQALHSQPRFGFRILLADCVVQGPRTEPSVLAALALAERLPVDLVVLVRGGGSKLDLGWLDSETHTDCRSRGAGDSLRARRHMYRRCQRATA